MNEYANEYAETTFIETGAAPNLPPAAQQIPHEGGISIHGHAKQLCVNKLGHTMVVPPDEDSRPVMFGQLFEKHRLRTVSYCAVFWSFGMCVAFLGPTLLDLECRTASVFSTMSWIFFSQSCFTLIGAACAGFIVQRINNNVVLLVSTAMLSITLALVPYCTYLSLLSMVLATMGFFMGTIDTVANISMIELYGRNVAPFLQALHFFYGLGAFLAPMIAEPFLMNEECTDTFLNSSHPRHKLPHNITQHFENIEPVPTPSSGSKIEYAFWILSAMQVPVFILLVFLVVHDMFYEEKVPEKPLPMYVESANGIEMTGENKTNYKSTTDFGGINSKMSDNRPDVSKTQVYLVTAFTASILFIYDGLQAGYGGYVFSYAVKSIAGMSMNEAAYLNACFWGTFAFGRLISIGLATKLAPSFMLICNINGCLFAMCLMLAFRHDHTVLYIGTALLGTSMSSVYPTAVTLAETYIDVTSSIASFLVAGAATGEMLIPVIIGHEFDAFGPVFLLITGVLMTIISGIIYYILSSVAETIVRQSSQRSFLMRMQNLFRSSQADINEDSGLLKQHVKFYRRMRPDTSDPDITSLPAEMNGIGHNVSQGDKYSHT